MAEDDSTTDSRYFFFFSLSIFFLLSYISYAIYVLYRLKMKLDRASITNIMFYTISFSLKFVNWTVTISGDGSIGILTYIDIITTQMIIINMYFFTFEMMSVYITMESTSYSAYMKNRKIGIAKRLVCILGQVIFFGICLIIYYDALVLGQYETSFISTKTLILISFRTLVLLIDIYVCSLFAKFFIYFSIIKWIRIKHQNGQLSAFNNFILGWIILLYVVYGLTLVLKWIFAALTVQQQSGWDINHLILYQYYRFLFLPLEDYCIAISMLYLFYYQGRLANGDIQEHSKGIQLSTEVLMEYNFQNFNMGSQVKYNIGSPLSVQKPRDQMVSNRSQSIGMPETQQNTRLTTVQAAGTVEDKSPLAVYGEQRFSPVYDDHQQYERTRSSNSSEFENEYMKVQDKSALQFRQFLFDYRYIFKARQQQLNKEEPGSPSPEFNLAHVVPK